MKRMKIYIDPRITEQVLIEDCLMKKYSGYDYMLILSFYALAKSWKKDKFIYYMKILK